MRIRHCFRSVFFALPLFAGLLLSGCNQSPATSTTAPKPAAARPAEPTTQAPFNRHARLKFTKHARCRMDCRHITAHEIEGILDAGTINYGKSEPSAHPDPKYAVEGTTDEHQHLRIIVAPSHDLLIVITCIELNVEWQCHCN